MSGKEQLGEGGADVQPGDRFNKVGLTAHKGQNLLYYIPADATLALDQGISPQWTRAHTFLDVINFGTPAAASLGLDGVSLKYTVGSGAHAFHVGGKEVGRIDDPSNPQTSDSLVSKGYVDTQKVGPGTSKYVAFSSQPLGIDATASVDSASQGSIAIGQGAYVSSANGAVALGTEASVQSAALGLALGFSAVCTGASSICLGATSNDGGESHVLSIGCTAQQWGGPLARRIINVADGQDDTDAATMGQIKGNRWISVSSQTGQLPQTSGSNSIAIGGDSSDQGQDGVVSIGLTLVESAVIQRRIINVADGRAGNEAATFGQLQNRTAPRLSLYYDGGFVGMKDGVADNGQIDALEHWPVTSQGILRSNTNSYEVVRVAKLAKQPCKYALTFLLYLNFKKIGSIIFEAGQSTGTIALDPNPDRHVIGGYWPIDVGDLLSLTRPHPPVAQDETAQGLLVVIDASVIWAATA